MRVMVLIISLAVGNVCASAAPTVITGTVTDEAGKPVADAGVWLPYGTPGEVGAVRTGGDGAFRLEYDPDQYPGWASVLVIATAAGRALGVAQCPRGAEAAAKIVLGPECQITGLVLDDQRQPIVGAEVRAESIEGDATYPRGYVYLGGRPQFGAVSDAQGRYTLGHLPRGASPRLTAKAKGYADFATPFGPQRAPGPVAGSGEDYAITLQRTVPIEGTVTHDGQPVPGVEVQASAEPPFQGGATAKTDEEGHYRLDGLGPGLYTVSVRGHPDLVAVAREHVLLPPNGSATGIDLTMTPGGLIEGRVVDADTGQGVAKARLIVQGPAHPAHERSPDVATTDDQGNYRVRVADGANRVVYAGGYGSTYADVSVTVREGETVRASDLALMSSRPVNVQVLGPDGQPAPGVALELLTGGQLAHELTDQQGRAVVEGAESRLGTAVLVRDAERKLVGCGTSPPRPTEPVVVKLESGASISVRVVGLDLNPLPDVGVSLHVRVPGDPQTGAELFSMPFAQARSGEDGIARFNGVPAHTKLYVGSDLRTGNSPNWPQCPLLEPGQTLDLGDVTLDLDLVVLRGTVLNPDQTPAAGALVQCLAARQEREVVCTDAGGRFEFADLPRDQPATLIAHTPDHKLGGFETLQPGWELEPGIALGPTGTARGRILTPEGQPSAALQAHVMLSLRDVETAVSWGEPMTDDQGSFTVTGLIPGLDYSVVVLAQKGGGLVQPLLSHPFRPEDAGDIDLGDLTLKAEP